MESSFAFILVVLKNLRITPKENYSICSVHDFKR